MLLWICSLVVITAACSRAGLLFMRFGLSKITENFPLTVTYIIIYRRQNAFARVCLSVCLLARLLKNACMDLDEMLRVDRCRDVDELINF